ncbi:MAG: hypothetical protein R3E86_15465 [Pseudomonadales bacterium]
MQKLTELVDCFQVYALCVSCDRMEPLPLPAIIAQAGPDITIADLRQRLRCRHCGRRSRDLRVVYVGPDASAAGFHYRR